MDKEKIGKFISRNRKEKEMTQKDLAEQLLQRMDQYVKTLLEGITT